MKHPMPSTAVALVFLLGLAQTVQAAPQAESKEGAIEHGKISTPDPSPVDPGRFELQPSFEYIRSTRAWDSSGNSHERGLFREQFLGFSATAGLINNVDININSGYSWIKDEDNDFDGDGFSGPLRGNNLTDLEMSGRYRFLNDEENHLEIAYIGGVTIPTGNDSDQSEIGTSQEYWSFDQTLVATKDWGQWTLNGDIGFSLPMGNKRDNDRGTLNTDLALGYQVLPWLQPEVELNYSQDFQKNVDDSKVLAVTAGFVMPINETLRVNIGVQQDVWGENTDKTTTIITSVRFTF